MYQESILGIDKSINEESIKTDTESRATSSTKNTTNQQIDEKYQFAINTIISIKDILSSYIIQFYRLIIQQMEYWDIPVPVLLKSSTT